jgi:CRP-like cAMP-binding protein
MDEAERASDTLLLLGRERNAIAMASHLQRVLAGLTDRERELSRGESLFRDGDAVESLFVVMAGELRVTCLLPHGPELTLQRAPAGAIVAESSLFAPFYTCDARAARSSTVRAVPVQRVAAALRASCELAECWARHLEAEVHRARSHAEIVSLRTVAERFDAWRALNPGALPPRGKWYELAEELGVSAEALYRELARRRHRPTQQPPALCAAADRHTPAARAV